jgi:hypothetical protein
MVGAKMANVSVPLLLKEPAGHLNPKGGIDANALLVEAANENAQRHRQLSCHG